MPAGGAADGEAALLESLEGDTEAGVVDAQALAQDAGRSWRADGRRWRAARTASASGSGGAAPTDRRPHQPHPCSPPAWRIASPHIEDSFRVAVLNARGGSVSVYFRARLPWWGGRGTLVA